MASATPQGPKLLYGFKRLTRFEKGLGAELPEAYKKFWREWKLTTPTAVHYVPKEGKWERDHITNKIRPIQNIPLPLIDTPESHSGIWGGEAVIKGFQKRHPLKRRVPHFWVPVLRRTVVHSEVLREYMSVIVTDRTMDKIHECFGFDHYILKHLACDLRSLLALKLKRLILIELLNGCPSHADNPEEQKRLLKEYKCYLASYTPEEIDWYGFSYPEAIRKLQAEIRAQHTIVPHKLEYRSKLLEQLQQAGITAASGKTSISSTDGEATAAGTDTDLKTIKTMLESTPSSSSSWLSKINPFNKKQKT